MSRWDRGRRRARWKHLDKMLWRSDLDGHGERGGRSVAPDRERRMVPESEHCARSGTRRMAVGTTGGRWNDGWPRKRREVRGCRRWRMAARATGRWRNRRGGARLPEVVDGRSSHGEMAETPGRCEAAGSGGWPRAPRGDGASHAELARATGEVAATPAGRAARPCHPGRAAAPQRPAGGDHRARRKQAGSAPALPPLATRPLRGRRAARTPPPSRASCRPPRGAGRGPPSCGCGRDP